MNEIQKIILTCLLGPEDPNGFKNFCKRAEGEIYRAKNPEKCRAASRKCNREKRQRDPEAARERVRSWRRENPEKTRELSRLSSAKRRLEDPEKSRKASRESNAKRKRERPEEVRALGRENMRKCRASNPDKYREISKRARTGEKRGAHLSRRRKNHSKRYATDIGYKIECCLRSRLLIALKVDGVSKSACTLELLGCPIEQFKTHLESQFKPGMTWSNHGPVWHIDHIKPCAQFNLVDPEQQRACFYWANFQPLFAEENQSKGGKYV